MENKGGDTNGKLKSVLKGERQEASWGPDLLPPTDKPASKGESHKKGPLNLGKR